MQAEKAADAVLNWETGAEYEGGGPLPTSGEEIANSPKDSGAACIIVEVRLATMDQSDVGPVSILHRKSQDQPIQAQATGIELTWSAQPIHYGTYA